VSEGARGGDGHQGSDGELPLELHLPAVPPPSPTLERALAELRPVATRRPLRALAIVALVSLGWMLVWVALMPTRRDLPFLPRAWWLTVALLWLSGFLAPLAMTLLPRRGAVLPDADRAARTAVVAMLGLILVAVALTPMSPATRVPGNLYECMHWTTHCLTRALAFASLPLVLTVVALRRVLVVGAARLVAAAGVAGGALGGLTLHMICPVGGALHLGCGHAGGIVVAALVGAGLGFVLDRYGQAPPRHKA
jgi:hypothetical protein